MIIQGNIVDAERRALYFGEVGADEGRIVGVRRLSPEARPRAGFIMPGFIDAHIHIESSMLVPSEFARLAVVHGTVATVSDPHEIANVLGREGVEYMIRNGEQVPFKFNFGVPSCVPATSFETAGARLDAAGVEALLRRPEVGYLAEMMNYPGVLQGDPEVLGKLAAARRLGKPVDGHAPGLRGEEARRYVGAGISTDHECFTYEEAREKLEYGMKILIREGSAARNFDALIDLLPQYSDRLMFCSDDKHPDDLVVGHINRLAARAVGRGFDLFQVIRAACLNPIDHYGLAVGRLREGDPADFIVVEDLEEFRVRATYIDGRCVAENGTSLILRQPVTVVNRFETGPKTEADFRVAAAGGRLRVIRALDGEIVTGAMTAPVRRRDGWAVADVETDVLKIAVVNRYADSAPAVGFIHGFGLRDGAVASSVAHDSHNIVAVGTDDDSLCRAVNLVVGQRGGIAAVGRGEERVLSLPVAGIMSDRDGYELARAYAGIDRFVKEKLGGALRAPFMTLSFMALLVIPDLKMSDRGLFDGRKFGFTPLFCQE